MTRPAHPPRPRGGFSLVELLVAMSVLLILVGMMLAVLSQTGEVWRSSSSRVEAYQSARRGFELLTRTLEQATLNTYWDYDNPNQPSRYIRQSHLHFLVAQAGEGGIPGKRGTGQAIFFQTPANFTREADQKGIDGLLNACGFFIEYGSDAAWLPAHLSASEARLRYRLMQWVEETEDLAVYARDGVGWIAPDAGAKAVPVAENVIALLIWPREEGASALPVLNHAAYDSRTDARPQALNQLPPVVQVALVAMDETSADRLGPNLEATVQSALSGLFNPANPAEDHFLRDLKTLEEHLVAHSIGHRIFVSSVPLREARWSR